MRLPKGTAKAEFDRLFVIESDNCVEWPYSRNGDGYGTVAWGGVVRGPHRISCIRAHGEPPFKGAHAAHSCHNRACMNPRHLSWKTAQQNALDRIADGTQTYGEQTNGVKLQESDVRKIRRAAGVGIHLQKIADRFGVSYSTVYFIKTRRSWSWLP